jgi:chemotaxis protein MotA
MDKTTLLGLIVGLFLITSAIFIGGQAPLFINIPSLLITVGGAIAATFIAFPYVQIAQTFQVTRKAFQAPRRNPVDVINMIVDFATTARRDGILALEEKAEELDYEFLKRGIQLAVDGTAPETLKEVMETEIVYLEERHKVGADIFGTLGAFAPAFGLIGTLIGLVSMLAQIDDPASIGPGMAVALLTTLYGAILANMICLPLEKKLQKRSSEEILALELVIEGVMSIQAGDNPRIVQDKLKAFVSPHLRDAIGGQAA